jgi:polar amino acid transport system substrate-binding protein
MSSITTLLFTILFWIPTFAQAETIVLKADRWCPFNCDSTESNKKENGYMIDVARIIFERKGHNVVYQIDSWSDSIKSVRSGKATGLVATTKADAPDLIYPEKSMGSSKECFYVKSTDKWEYVGVETLKDKKIGTVESYAYSGELTTYLLEHPDQLFKATGSSPLDINIESLNSGKVNTFIENPFVFNFYTEKKKIRDNFADAGCTEGDDLYIGFSPTNPRSKEFAKILTEGIQELRKDGTLDKIINKYSLKEWSP